MGLWLVGSCGGVGSSVAVALAALADKLVEPVGCVTALPELAHLRLAAFSEIVLGGHEVRHTDWTKGAAEIQSKAEIFSEELVARCRPKLRKWSRNLRPGTSLNSGRPVARMADWSNGRPGQPLLAVVERLRADLDGFRRRHGLARVVVVNVASTEPPFPLGEVHRSWAGLRRALASRQTGVLPASSLYAAAAILGGHAYVNFTPSTGATVPALAELAEQTGAVLAGDDGKTGETLIKSVLAPMFAARNLRLLSWSGHNILGNRDGQVLADPGTKKSKIQSKNHLIATIVGYQPQTNVSIDFVESLHDWKTAWDFIHFEGLLGTKMSLQFIWQGCDSVLAAPLVIDLARLASFHQQIGGVGVMPHLACFFKRPMGTREQDFFKQFRTLLDYAARHSESKRLGVSKS